MAHRCKKDGEDDEMKVPRVSPDYFFLNKENGEDKTKNEDDKMEQDDEQNKLNYAGAVSESSSRSSSPSSLSLVVWS